MMLLDAVYTICQSWSSVNPVTLVRLWRKLVPDVEDDLYGFPTQEIMKSKILKHGVCYEKF
jgi:hypothetical protein